MVDIPKPGEREPVKTLFGIPQYGLAGIIVISSFLVYANTLINGFVYDDFYQIMGNPWIKDLRNIPLIFSRDVSGFVSGYSTSYYRPLMHIIYMFTYHIFGIRPWGFHLVNVVFHCGVSVLIFFITTEIFRKGNEGKVFNPYMAGLLASLLFAVHPVHTEAVAWIGAVGDLSSSFFFLLTLYLYIRSADRSHVSKGMYFLSVISFFLASLSKEPALTLPIILIAYDIIFKNERNGPLHMVMRYVPFVLVAGVYFVMRFLALGGFAPIRRSIEIDNTVYLNIFPLFIKYIKKLIVPVNLSFFYPPLQTVNVSDTYFMISVFLTVVFLVCFFVSIRKSKVTSFGLILFLVPLLPAFYIPAVIEGGFGERYLYLPSAGFVILVTLLLSRLRIKALKGDVLPMIIVIPLILMYSLGTVNRNTVWRDEYSLWSDTVRKSPDSPLPHGALGKALLDKGRIDDAINEFQISLSLKESSAEGHVNLGVAYLSKGLINQAITEFKRALVITPEYPLANFNLGVAYFNQGLIKKSIEHLERAVASEPDNAVFRQGLSKARHVKKGSRKIHK